MDGQFEFFERCLARTRGSRTSLKTWAATSWIDWTNSPGPESLPGCAVAAATLLISILWTAHVVADPRHHPWYFIPVISAGLLVLTLLAHKLMLGSRWISFPAASRSRLLTCGLCLPLLILAGGLLLTRHGQVLWPLSAGLLSLFIVGEWPRIEWPHWTVAIRRIIHVFQISSSDAKEHSAMPTVLDSRPSGHPRFAAESAHGLHPIHWMQRTIDSHGTEHLKGVMQVEFPSGQSFLTAHIPFCPPFAHTPVFECHPVTQEQIRVRASVAYPYGARIELKRQGSPQATLSVEIEFSAVSSPVRSRAA